MKNYSTNKTDFPPVCPRVGFKKRDCDHDQCKDAELMHCQADCEWCYKKLFPSYTAKPDMERRNGNYAIQGRVEAPPPIQAINSAELLVKIFGESPELHKPIEVCVKPAQEDPETVSLNICVKIGECANIIDFIDKFLRSDKRMFRKTSEGLALNINLSEGSALHETIERSILAGLQKHRTELLEQLSGLKAELTNKTL